MDLILEASVEKGEAMTHGNAPLSLEGCRRLVYPYQYRSIAHVAAPSWSTSLACDAQTLAPRQHPPDESVASTILRL